MSSILNTIVKNYSPLNLLFYIEVQQQLLVLPTRLLFFKFISFNYASYVWVKTNCVYIKNIRHESYNAKFVKNLNYLFAYTTNVLKNKTVNINFVVTLSSSTVVVNHVMV